MAAALPQHPVGSFCYLCAVWWIRPRRVIVTVASSCRPCLVALFCLGLVCAFLRASVWLVGGECLVLHAHWKVLVRAVPLRLEFA
jgi:hypothetical protein